MNCYQWDKIMSMMSYVVSNITGMKCTVTLTQKTKWEEIKLKCSEVLELCGKWQNISIYTRLR